MRNKGGREKETELFQDGGQIKRQKDIYHHRPRPIFIYHLPPSRLPYLSLVTTFNALKLARTGKFFIVTILDIGFDSSKLKEPTPCQAEDAVHPGDPQRRPTGSGSSHPRPGRCSLS
jgi:hypothetical protein